MKKYSQFRKQVYNHINDLENNPEIGELLKAGKFKGMRHDKINSNFAIFYVYCKEAKNLRNGVKCPWCKEDCSKIDEDTLVLLNFGSHDITDNIR